MKENKNTSFIKNKFIILSIICTFSGIGCFATFYFGSDKLSEIENLSYAKGQLDYSSTPWIYRYNYWRLNPRRLMRKHSLDLYLEDDLSRYTASSHLISNLYEEPFQKLVNDYPQPMVVLGYLETEDPYVNEVYSIEINGLQLVDIEGVKTSFRNQKILQICATVILLLLSIIFVFVYFQKAKKEHLKSI